MMTLKTSTIIWTKKHSAFVLFGPDSKEMCHKTTILMIDNGEKNPLKHLPFSSSKEIKKKMKLTK